MSSDAQSLYLPVTLASLAGVVLATFFYLRLLRRVRRFVFHFLTVVGERRLWHVGMVILLSCLLLIQALGIKPINVRIYKAFELTSSILFVLAWILLSESFLSHKFSSNILATFLKQDLDDYVTVVFSITGQVNVAKIIQDLSEEVARKGIEPIFILGRTPPSRVKGDHVIWVTGIQVGDVPGLRIVSGDDPTELNIQVEAEVKRVGDRPVLLVGDYLDVLLEALSPATFHRYWLALVSSLEKQRHGGFFVLREDVHDPKMVNLVKSYCDVLVEIRERSEGTRIFTEMRVANIVDDIYSDWLKVPIMRAGG